MPDQYRKNIVIKIEPHGLKLCKVNMDTCRSHMNFISENAVEGRVSPAVDMERSEA